MCMCRFKKRKEELCQWRGYVATNRFKHGPDFFLSDCIYKETIVAQTLMKNSFCNIDDHFINSTLHANMYVITIIVFIMENVRGIFKIPRVSVPLFYLQIVACALS
jgi:hypothetical protein